MTELKLRVGGAYIDRRGERVVIVHDDGEYGAYRFGSATGRYYTPDGRWSVGLDSPYDLVSEIIEAPPAPPPSDDLRTRAALAALTGILAGTGLGIARSRLPRPDQVANMAVDYADALIAALKGATHFRHIGPLPEVKLPSGRAIKRNCRQL